MGQLHEDVLSTIGRTPVVGIRRLAPPGVRMWVKCESRNPMGSVKDRLALGLIESALRRGELRAGQTVVEATSGNTGIGLAMVCAAMGFPLVVVMSESFSLERRRILRHLGARVVLTPASERATGMAAKARELADAHGWFLCRQFESPENAAVHQRTTAREILEDFEGERLDVFVSGYGTGGTLLGVARALRAERPGVRIVACEPANSRLLGSGEPQRRQADGSPAAAHPAFRTHPVQGWASDFLPLLAEEAAGLLDAVEPVQAEEGLRQARELARAEGLFVGISAGATFAAARQIALRSEPGTSLLCLLPDTAERYLSTPLFEERPDEMDAREQALSRSTPSARFDAPARPVAAPLESHTALELARARAWVEAALAEPGPPLRLFALEWCEFCWSAQRLLRELEVPFRTLLLDADGLERPAALRAALEAKSGLRTVPQVFLGDRCLGGASELFAAHRDGSLWRQLAAHGIECARRPDLDPATLLPAWLHPR